MQRKKRVAGAEANSQLLSGVSHHHDMSKRTHEDGDDGGSNKKVKSDMDIIAAKRAEITAKLAALRGSPVAAVGSNGPKPAGNDMGWTPDSRARKPAPSNAEDIHRRLEQARKKAAEKVLPQNPYSSRQPSKPSTPAPATPDAGGGGLHPLLLDAASTAPKEQSKKERYKPMLPKFSTVKANARNAPSPAPAASGVPSRAASGTPKPAVTNPYLSQATASTSQAPGTPGSTAPPEKPDFFGQPKDRASGRQLKFNQKGKYINLASKIRQEAQLEELRKRIAERAERAGMSGDSVGAGPGAGGIRRPAPPAAEWWDEPLLPSKSYKDVMNLGVEGLSMMLRTAANSPITIYIQHPIPIPPPTSAMGGTGATETKIMLTSREQKKKRKLIRKQAQQDKRDRIKMGLLPPDPPKVRLSNLMRVLTSSAVADPTKVEARVRREVAQRKHGHEKMNAERKLTAEEKQEKRREKEEREERKGIWGCVYKVRTLSDPSHQFKVRKNAEQMNLTGLCIFNPNFSLVYVEGAAKNVRAYKKLMLNRISWTTPARARNEPELELDEEAAAEAAAAKAVAAESAGPAQVEVNLADNRCDLVWEGQIRNREFGVFRARSCPTDAMARDVLGERLRGYWDMSRSWRVEDLDE